VDFGETGKRAIAIRTFITSDFMTGVPACPGKNIPEAAYVPALISSRVARTFCFFWSCFGLGRAYH
jgi:hypothetical protein